MALTGLHVRRAGDGDSAFLRPMWYAAAFWQPAYRLFPEDAPGYGFVDADTPELALGVESDSRGRGVGTALLEALIEAAREEGRPSLSLSVNRTNPSRRIYQRCGFADVSWDDDSYVMLLPL